MENNLISIENIEKMIYEMRGVQVMLDSDIANLYHVETKRINEAVKNNPSKFPDRYCWIVDKNELEILRSNISTSKLNFNKYGGIRYNPRVFTEQGLYMLATILKSDVAAKVSIAIMDTFVKMRHYINYNNVLLPNRIFLLEEKTDNNTKRIDELFDMFNPKDITKNKIYFEGDYYDAYSFLIKTLNNAKKEIIIIDNYAGIELLDILKDINKKIIIVSKNINDTLKEKYLKQYTNVKFIYNDSFHDRFIIIDKKRLYSCGSSFKDFGKKCFVISDYDNGDYLKELLKIIYKK